MQLRHLKTVHSPSDGINRVTGIAWSPNNKKLAIVTADRVVHLFDENGEKKDRFATKPGDSKGPKNYVVRDIAFSPDSAKLAVAQSDNIVFVYKLGVEWGEKKSIVNKFLQSSSVTCLCWPRQRMNEVVFGLAEGNLKVGQLRSNKPGRLYSTESYVVTLCPSPDGNGFLSGHADGSVYRFDFTSADAAQQAHQKVCAHPCVPVALSWGEHIVCAGNDKKIVMYDPNGQGMVQMFDYSDDVGVKDFTSATFNPTGDCCVVGNFNQFFTLSYSPQKQLWEEVGVKKIENYYTVTSASWKPDGSKLALGSLCGAADMFDACIRRYKYRDNYEFTYVSLCQVIVKRIDTGARIILRSNFGYEINKINIFNDRFLIAHTPETLLMGNLESCRLSEVQWSNGGGEKYFFDDPQLCMVYKAGELSIVEYGSHEILGSCRTEQVSPHLLSVRINEARSRAEQGVDNKKIAYLRDVHTIRVLDLVSGSDVATINHEAKVDWLELNARATILLFRDKRRQLHLFDVLKQERTTLLDYCNYVQWVPNSDVVVAQSRQNLYVWYSIKNPDRATIYEIKGDVEDIDRSNGKTEVIVNEGISTTSYTVDEALMEFGAAVERYDFERALRCLETLELTPETEAMWEQLAKLALAERRLNIAEKCYAAIRDVSKARYLRQAYKIADYAAKEMNQGDGTDHYLVRAKLLALDKSFAAAERTLVDQGQIEEAMEMYQELHKWDDAIRRAEQSHHPEVQQLKTNYYEWLIDSGQEEKAAELKEREGDYAKSLQLYLKAGMPARAAKLIQSYTFSYQHHDVEAIAQALVEARMFGRAGEFFEKLGSFDKAAECYRKGHVYQPLLKLCRKEPSLRHKVVEYEEECGDYLVSQKQVDAAIDHYREAGQTLKAIEAAVGAKQFGKAASLAEALEPDVAAPFYRRIAKHYEQTKQYKDAENYYLRAKDPNAVVYMYANLHKWEDAHRIAKQFMSEQQVAVLFIQHAEHLAMQSRYREAEKLYMTVGEVDLAINMYKKSRQYDHMIRLVGKYRRELLQNTHAHLAQQLEAEGAYKEAEHHYIEAKDWKSAVTMYKDNDLWDDALRIAKHHGGVNASKQVAYMWAVSLGVDASAKILVKFGLLEQAIEYACESTDFEHAFQMANYAGEAMVKSVHLKYAMFMEDQGQFRRAEEEFIKADKPKEAIDMYIHTEDWDAALNVAENYDPSSVTEVFKARGKRCEANKQYSLAEAQYLKAKKPDLAIKMYEEARSWQDALRVGKEYLPHKLEELTSRYRNFMTLGSSTGGHAAADFLQQAKALEENGSYGQAIDAYLKVTSDRPGQGMDVLQKVWLQAVDIAVQRVPDRAKEVADVVARRLSASQLHDKAAALYFRVNMFKEGIDCYVESNQWSKAEAAAQDYLPWYLDHIRARRGKSSGRGDVGGASEVVAGGGTVSSDMNALMQRGEWDKVYEIANKQGADAVMQYAAQHVTHLLKSQRYIEAVRVFAKYGCPPIPHNFPLYQRLAKSVLANSSGVEGEEEGLLELREMLYKLVEALNTASSMPRDEVKTFERLLLIVHFITLKNLCLKRNLIEIAAKLSVSCLRYIMDIPADKAFYEAGSLCRRAAQSHTDPERARAFTAMAVTFLNRYLDISELIDDPDGGNVLDNGDFEGTDIPFDFPLPDSQFLSSDKREEIRDWVLTVSMDQSIDLSLPKRADEMSGDDMYEASLRGPSGDEKTPCVVSGYPVVQGQAVRCRGCGHSACREDWNSYISVMRTCPWCSTVQHTKNI
eukprot:Rmarinus@m.5702